MPLRRRAVVAFPRIETELEWERVVAFRGRHDPLARRVRPHITLAKAGRSVHPSTASW